MYEAYWLSIQLVHIVITISIFTIISAINRFVIIIIMTDELEGHTRETDILPGSNGKPA